MTPTIPRPSLRPQRWSPPPTLRRHTVETRYELSRIEVPGQGPEDVVLDADGNLFTGLYDGRILRIGKGGDLIETVARTRGRPLGIELLPGGKLLVCDAKRGLMSVDPGTGQTQFIVERVNGQPLVLCNNAAVAKDGTIYFSESTQRFGIDHWRAELFEHSATGRLMRVTPSGSVEVLLEGLSFANGVALAPDESFVAVAETGGYCVRRVWLTGPRQGKSDTLIEHLPAFPDNMSTGTDGLLWIALASPRNALLDFLLPKHPGLRQLAWAVPERLQPGPQQTAWIMAIDTSGRIVHDIELRGAGYHMVTGVREVNGTLYLGSLEERALAVLRPLATV